MLDQWSVFVGVADHRYHLWDGVTVVDWAKREGGLEGPVRPLPSDASAFQAVVVEAGLDDGYVPVTVSVHEEPLPSAPPGTVGFEFDMIPGGGQILITSTEGRVFAPLVSGAQPMRWRVRLTLKSSPDADLPAVGEVGQERHLIDLWPSRSPMPLIPVPAEVTPTLEEAGTEPRVTVRMRWAGLVVPRGRDAAEYALTQPAGEVVVRPTS